MPERGTTLRSCMDWSYVIEATGWILFGGLMGWAMASVHYGARGGRG
jgi:hypothetical protein